MRGADFKHSDDETLWSMSPCVRKPWAKKRSRPPHHVPLAGWAAAAQRRIYAVSEGEWLLPVRPRNLDVAPKQPHANPNWITKLVERLPGMDMNPHRIRDARASYGPERLGWAKNDTNTVLDHLERFDPDDVTAQHYNTSPMLVRKREMMRQWLAFLDACEAEARAADRRSPTSHGYATGSTASGTASSAGAAPSSARRMPGMRTPPDRGLYIPRRAVGGTYTPHCRRVSKATHRGLFVSHATPGRRLS
jgi:hypothetical protein